MEPQPEPLGQPMKSEFSIFHYTDYREYLRDFIAVKKQTSRGFSIRQLCLNAGISTENYILRVIRAQRNLGPRNAERLLEALRLENTERQYFHLLMQKENARTVESKMKYFERIQSIQRRRKVENRTIDNSILRDWHTMVILELARCLNFSFEPANISRSLNKNVSPFQISESIDFLVNKGYLSKKNGKWKVNEFSIGTTDGTLDLLVQLNHRANLLMAADALDWPLSKRGNWGLTLAMQKKRIPELKSRLRKAMEEISNEFANDPQSDSVFRIGAYCFAQAEISKIPENKSGR